jgi:lysophospholipase L1-like esterase
MSGWTIHSRPLVHSPAPEPFPGPGRGPSVDGVIGSHRPFALLAAFAATVGLAVAGPPAAAAEPLPTAVVVLGDSEASGDGAGAYEPGTRGEHGDWCHRSTRAYVYRTGLGTGLNLACSGADSGDVGFGSGTHYTEGSQAARLVDVARRQRVGTVVVQTGANDDAALVDTGIACILAFLDPGLRPCRETLDPLLDERMAATTAKVTAAVRDVREAMRRAGYADRDYQLVVASYPAPITERMGPLAPARGCPYRRADAAWGRTTLFPRLSAALHAAAVRADARFLDLSRATEGREACSHARPSQEWQRRIAVDPEAFVSGGPDAIGYHLAQESFHPNATAHAEIGRCLGAFVRSGAPSAACVADADGRLRPDRGSPAVGPA